MIVCSEINHDNATLIGTCVAYLVSRLAFYPISYHTMTFRDFWKMKWIGYISDRAIHLLYRNRLKDAVISKAFGGWRPVITSNLV